MFEFCITLDGEDYIVHVKRFTPASPGRTWGPPEHCYPPTGSEADFDLVCEMTGDFADLVACRHYDTIMAEIDDQAAARATDYEEEK